MKEYFGFKTGDDINTTIEIKIKPFEALSKDALQNHNEAERLGKFLQKNLTVNTIKDLIKYLQEEF